MSEESKDIKLTNKEYQNKLENAVKDLNNYCEKLRQENHRLKQAVKDTFDTSQEIMAELEKYCCKRNDCSGRIKENQKKTAAEILEELKKWLVEEWKNESYSVGHHVCLAMLSSKIEELKEESD